MRRLIAAVIALTAFAAFSESAWAKQRPLAYMSSQWLRQACGQNGGTYNDAGNGHYSCDKECKNSSGGSDICSIDCDSKKKTCQSDTPTRIAAGATFSQVLSNGVAVQTVRNPVPGNILDGPAIFATPRPAATGRPAPN